MEIREESKNKNVHRKIKLKEKIIEMNKKEMRYNVAP